MLLILVVSLGVVFAEGPRQITGTCYGGLSKEIMHKALSVQRTGDNTAFRKMFALGQIVHLSKGDYVYFEECIGWTCAFVKIRPKGSIQSLVTASECVSK